MPRVKVTDQEFLARTAPLFANTAEKPTLKQLAKAARLSIGGVQHKLNKLNIRRRDRFVIPPEVADIIDR
jgi:hypothetical protein